MYKISVILPVCNVEPYLVECIESIIHQTIGFKDIQLIMIDDGSDDNSYGIMQDYANMYTNIKTYHFDKKSGSGGRPRNKGIEMAEGKYLMFADPDDFFSLTAFETMYAAIEKHQSDFVIGNWCYTNIDGTPWEKPIFDTERFKEFKLSINDYKDSFYVMNSSMCNKIFNKKFILSNNITCLEGIPGEDTYFSMSAFLNAKNVFYIPEVTYYYRQRNTSCVSVSWNCSAEFFNGMNTAYRALYEKFLEKDQINFYKFVYAKNMTYLLYRFIDSTQLKDDERLEILANSRWFFKLSRDLNVPACQKSLKILLDKIIIGEYNDVIDICKIISEMRTYMAADVRQNMSKPTQETIDEIIKSLKGDNNV